jgi:hypothetical protein
MLRIGIEQFDARFPIDMSVRLGNIKKGSELAVSHIPQFGDAASSTGDAHLL